jgi:hypothetical protein
VAVSAVEIAKGYLPNALQSGCGSRGSVLTSSMVSLLEFSPTFSASVENEAPAESLPALASVSPDDLLDVVATGQGRVRHGASRRASGAASLQPNPSVQLPRRCTRGRAPHTHARPRLAHAIVIPNPRSRRFKSGPAVRDLLFRLFVPFG